MAGKKYFSQFKTLGFIFSIVFLNFVIDIHSQTFFRRTRLPCEAAGYDGIVVAIKIPATARYQDNHAPVVIYHPGGFAGVGIGDEDANLVNYGFIEVSFNFPGCGLGEQMSGGVYDHRGPLSLQGSRDVIRFAMGFSFDSDGKLFSEIVAPIVPLKTNVGLIGYSFGGSTNICVAGQYGQDLPYFAWILNWESPVGDGMPQAECGSKPTSLRPFNAEQNPAYNANDGTWDLSSLAYDSKIRMQELDGEGEVVGGLYFDFDADAAVDLGEDFIAYPLVFRIENQLTAYHSVRFRTEAEQRNLFPNPLPPHIPTLEDTKTFWFYRDGEYWIDSTVQKIPQLMFMVTASELDHVQRSPDHPHVLLQYEGFRNAGARLVRLNPDRIYTEYILGHAATAAVDNDAFFAFDHVSIRSAIEPGSFEDELGRETNVAAGACELADRTQTNNLAPQLDELASVNQRIAGAIIKFQLFQNYPNPFNSRTDISYQLSAASRVELIIFNVLGREVRSLVNQIEKAGEHHVIWDGRDDRANPVNSGIYFYQLSLNGNQFRCKKLVLSK